MARVVVLLLALYTVVDFATPLLPGAFRFDESQSIEAGGRAALRLVVVADGAAASRPVRIVHQDPSPTLGPMRRRHHAPSRRLDGARPARTDSPSDSSDDH